MADAGKILNTLESAVGRINKGSDVLLAKYDSQESSDWFSVTDTPLRLAAFGLGPNEVVRVVRLYLPSGQANRDCCGKLDGVGEILEKNHTVGGHAVLLNSTVDEVVIDAKGVYRLVYEGNNRPDVQVVMLPDDVASVNNTVRGLSALSIVPMPPVPIVEIEDEK